MSFDFTITQVYTPEKSFIEQYGLVQHSDHRARSYRMWTENTGLCEMCGGYGSHFRVIVDHCHEHGWIRGFTCTSCNNLLGKYELGIRTLYDTLVCPHAHWRYRLKSGEYSKQAITNYENCLANIERNIRLYQAWATQIGKCPDCHPRMRLYKLPELLESIPAGISQGSHPKGQISAGYLQSHRTKGTP